MFEIGKEYWFNLERKANCLKDTCKGILQNIYSDGTKTLYSFTDVEIYACMDNECLDYDFYGTYSDTTVFKKDIFKIFRKMFLLDVIVHGNVEMLLVMEFGIMLKRM